MAHSPGSRLGGEWTVTDCQGSRQALIAVILGFSLVIHNSVGCVNGYAMVD